MPKWKKRITKTEIVLGVIAFVVCSLGAVSAAVAFVWTMVYFFLQVIGPPT